MLILIVYLYTTKEVQTLDFKFFDKEGLWKTNFESSVFFLATIFQNLLAHAKNRKFALRSCQTFRLYVCAKTAYINEKTPRRL